MHICFPEFSRLLNLLGIFSLGSNLVFFGFFEVTEYKGYKAN